MGGVVTAYYMKHIQELAFKPTLKVYSQSIVLKKTLESISLERSRRLNQDDFDEEEWDSSMRENECEAKSAQLKNKV